MKKNSRLKLGFLVLFCLLLMMLSYFYVRFDLKQTRYIETDFISELNELDFSSVKEIINDKSAFPSTLTSENNTWFVKYKEKKIINLADLLEGEIYLDDINNSYRSSIYSLTFLRNFLLNENDANVDVEFMDSVVDRIIYKSESLLSADRYMNYDHPVAERLETLLLYTAYKNDLGYELNEKQYQQINHLIYLLNENDHFTYNMNHGLMQIRSLARAGLLLNNERLFNKAVHYLKDVRHIYYAEDGSILESAFGYQTYIYNQFVLLNSILLRNENELLVDDLKLMESYLKTISSKSGFLQGTGDSYNQILNEGYLKPIANSYNIFKYSNQVAGVKSNVNDFILHFVSLDNKPNVHKLKEDLSIYLYHNSPLFYNSGQYSYSSKDSIREMILGNKLQNGPKFINGEVRGSEILNVEKNDSLISFIGIGYNKRDTLLREIKFDLRKNLVNISDSSSAQIYSSYVINPKLRVQQIDFNSIRLGNHFELNSTDTIHLKSTVISDDFKSIKETKKAIIKGNNTVNISLSFDLEIATNNMILNDKSSKRAELTRGLKTKYPKILFLNKLNLSYIYALLSFIIFSIIIMIFPFKVLRYTLYISLLFLIVNIFLKGRILIELAFGFKDILKNIL